jgi:hypothetical protein
MSDGVEGKPEPEPTKHKVGWFFFLMAGLLIFFKWLWNGYECH